MKWVTNITKNLIVVAAFAAILPVQIMVNLQQTWQRPIDLGDETFIWIPRGVGLNYLSHEFVRQGFISEPWQLAVGTKVFKDHPTIRFGEYALSGKKNIPQIIAELKTAKPYTRSITLTEGTSVAEAASVLWWRRARIQHCAP